MDNNWTASTSTNWIFFDSSHRAKTATGTGNQSITIYVEEATDTDSQSEGLITIKTPTGTISKTIKRCIPTVVSEQKYLSAKINGTTYSGVTTSSSIELGPCNGGSSSQSGGNIIDVKNVILYIVQTLNYGTPKTTTTPLAESDYNITYKVNGTELSVLDANNGKDRDVVVNVKYKNDNSVSGVSVTVKQKGIKTGDGTYDYNIDMIDVNSSGYVESSVTYGEISFNENCSNITASSCNNGNFTFSCNGQVTYNYGAVTANTKCGNPITIKSSSTDTGNIKNSDITYSIEPQSAGTFNGNVLTYYENKSRQNEIITINAKLTQDITKTASTTFTVPSGNCAPKMYLHASIVNQDDDTEVQYIEMTGNSVVFKCYLTNQENDGEADRITDEEIISCIDSMFEERIAAGTKQIDNGFYRRNIEFGRIPQEYEEIGHEWSCSATCEYAANSPLVKHIYQANKYEHIIPNCDYFIFSYEWTSGDGRDLDSLTQISTKNGNLSGKTERYDIAPINEKIVGFGASKEVYGADDKLYLKFGGDNMCNGSEYTCVCMKNILKAAESGQISLDDEIYIDIYANWFSDKQRGEASIIYNQYSGKPEGDFDTEITVNKRTDCEFGSYSSFTNNESSGCKVIANEMRISNLTVTAAGMRNNYIADNIDCIDKVYSRVLRLIYKVNGSTSYTTEQNTNGLDLRNSYCNFYKDGNIWKYINIGGIECDDCKNVNYNSMDSSTSYYNNFNQYLPTAGGHIKYEKFHIETTFDGGNHFIRPNIFNENNNDSLKVYIKSTNIETIRKENLGRPYTIIGDNGVNISNFTVTKNNDDENSLDISFDCPQYDESNGSIELVLYFNVKMSLEVEEDGEVVKLCDDIYLNAPKIILKQLPPQEASN